MQQIDTIPKNVFLKDILLYKKHFRRGLCGHYFYIFKFRNLARMFMALLLDTVSKKDIAPTTAPQTSICYRFWVDFGSSFWFFVAWFLCFPEYVFSCISLGSFFHTFCDFGVPRASKIDAFWINFERFFVIRRIRENDVLAWVSARFCRSRASRNHGFLMFFDVLNWSALLRPVFLVLLCFLMIWGVLVESILTIFCLRKTVQIYNEKSGKIRVSKTGVGGTRVELWRYKETSHSEKSIAKH